MIRMLGIDQDGHLVRPESALNLQSIHHLRSGPALGRPEHDHRPAGPAVSLLFRAFVWIWRISSITFSKVAAMS